MMVKLCAFCGFKLRHPIKDGITTCDNCQRVFSTSSFIKILSAAWSVRKWHVEDLESLRIQCDLSNEDLAIVGEYVVERRFVHDDLLKVLKDMEISTIA